MERMSEPPQNFSENQVAEWRGWNIHKAGYPNTIAVDDFAELVKAKTNGRISLNQ